jgi:hypothetical protein
MTNDAENAFWDRLFQFSIRMAAASIAIVGLLLVVTYEFRHAEELTEAYRWLRTTHLGIAAAFSFFITSSIGVVARIPYLKRLKKVLSCIMIITLAIGWLLMFYLLFILFVETY